ncbi:MAG: UpxY family transcription antiterminator [Bacteroidales bacterium]|nr:UpxY family transcription antiterminator [Bacteroidales bacterium]
MAASDKLPWYALYVHSRAEKKVHARITEMGIESYLPLVTRMKMWSDRIKKVEEPLFKSYLFVRTDLKNYYDIVNIPGVTKFVSFEKKAVVVPENQINAIKRYCEDFTDDDEKTAEDIELHEGQLVRITRGEMMGLVGRLASFSNKKRLIVYIESVGQYLPVNVARTKVEPVYEKAV